MPKSHTSAGTKRMPPPMPTTPDTIPTMRPTSSAKPTIYPSSICLVSHSRQPRLQPKPCGRRFGRMDPPDGPRGAEARYIVSWDNYLSSFVASGYSSSPIAVLRKHDAKCPFPQEKDTLYDSCKGM